MDISFILPCYNVKDYVKDCINSIINSEFCELNYEIICVDDCSVDGTVELLEELSNEDEHIVLIKNKINKGVSYCRNVGIDNAKGEWIWFVDSDDLVVGSVCELIRFANEKGSEVVYFNAQTIDENYNLKTGDVPKIGSVFGSSASVHIQKEII